MINDVTKSCEILVLAIHNLIDSGRLIELAKVIFDVNLETVLQSKLNGLEINIAPHTHVHEGAMRASVEYFLKRSEEVCLDYQFATNPCSGVLSLFRCLESNINEGNYVLLYMLTSEVFLELIVKMDQNSLSEFRIAEYLIPEDDKEDAINTLFDRVQRISEQTATRKNDDQNDDFDIQF